MVLRFRNLFANADTQKAHTGCSSAPDRTRNIEIRTSFHSPQKDPFPLRLLLKGSKFSLTLLNKISQQQCSPSLFQIHAVSLNLMCRRGLGYVKGRLWEQNWRLPALLRKCNSLLLFKMDAPLASCSINFFPLCK